MMTTQLMTNVLFDSAKYAVTYKLLDVLNIGKFISTGSEYADSAVENLVVSQSSNIVTELSRKFNIPLLNRSSVQSRGFDYKTIIMQTVSDTIASSLMDYSGLSDMISGSQNQRDSTSLMSQVIAYLRVGLNFVLTKFISTMLQNQYSQILGTVKSGYMSASPLKSVLY